MKESLIITLGLAGVGATEGEEASEGMGAGGPQGEGAPPLRTCRDDLTHPHRMSATRDRQER